MKILFIMGLGVLFCTIEYGRRKSFLAYSLLVLSAAVIVAASNALVREEIMTDIAQEVSLAQVPTKGEFTYIAQVEIIYKDGELIRVGLVKGTTKPKE